MSLAPGTRLGPYRIQSAIGAGGMGEVYKARDMRLDRTVAIKVLPEGVAADPERRRRFDHEARAVAALNHPHICALHDIGREGDTDFLVMEYLDGRTLAERLVKGPLPLEQAVEVGVEIADALAVAHERGIIHRDLKPGNVMLTKTGAKLLDFGLARLTHALDDSGASVTATTVGTVVGTVPYMAPEQVEGRPTDARTDLFAFGAVLYEMLTGRRAFDGESPASVMAAILEHEPEALSARQPLVPPALERLVTRCLAKDPDDRWQTARDLAFAIGSQRGGDPLPAVPAALPRRRTAWIAGLSLVATALTGAGLGLYFRPAPSPPTAHLGISLAEAGLTLTSGGVAISPDGQTIVFGARKGDDSPRLYIRRLDDPEPRPLKGTEDATSPFFRPDGRWLAFAANGKLEKLLLESGEVQTLCPIGYQGLGRGFWGTDGRIFFSQWPGGLAWVSEAGGSSTPLIRSGGTVRFLWPHVLPEGRTLIYTVLTEQGHVDVAALSLATRTSSTLVSNASCARYLRTGHLVYEREGTLRAVRFDPDSLQTSGTERIVLADVTVEHVSSGILVDYDVSATGTVLAMPRATTLGRVVWRDRSGNVIPLRFAARDYDWPSLSADGRRLAITVRKWPAVHVWVGRIEGEPLMQLTYGGDEVAGVTSRDGRWVAYSGSRSGGTTCSGSWPTGRARRSV